MPQKPRKVKKKLIIAAVLTGIILFVGISVIYIAHIYISKMNFVGNGTSTAESTVSEAASGMDTGNDGAGAGEDGADPDIDVSPNTEVSQKGKDTTQDDVDKIQREIEANIAGVKNKDLYTDNVLNVLVIGSDARSKGEKARADTMILISINQSTKKMVVTSFMRDIYLKIPGYGYNRLNAAYAFGGAGLLMDTIELNFKVKIEKYVQFDFESFVNLVNGMGGIDFYVDIDDIQDINSVLDSEDQMPEIAGIQHLNGNQALAFVRNREYVDGDFTRTKNQRALVTELLCNKFLKLSLSEANDLLCAYLPQITTSFQEREIMYLMIKIPEYSGYDIEQLCVPSADSFSYAKIKGMSVLSIDLGKNTDSILNAIYQKEDIQKKKS